MPHGIEGLATVEKDLNADDASISEGPDPGAVRLDLRLGSGQLLGLAALTLDDLARWLNPIVAGWMNYYGRFYRSAMEPLLQRVSTYLRRWAGKKYRRLRTHQRFKAWWTGLIERQPRLFAQWKWVRTY